MKTKKNIKGILNKNTKKENKINTKTNKIAICLLGYQPTNELLELYDGLFLEDKYDIYIVVDDNNYDIDDLKIRFNNFNFIKVKEETCYKYGYTHLAFTVKKGEPSAWDKGIYYFCEENKKDYKYIWFLEDDVFIPLPDTIKNIDKKYGDADLLIQKNKLINNKNIEFSHKEELNKYMDNIFKPYLSKSMICAIRISNIFIKIIKEYAKKYKELFFSEFFFITLANYYKLKIKVVDEFKNIIFRKIWTIDDIFKEQTQLFHPVKDFFLQKSFRKTLESNDIYFILKRVFKKKLLDSKDIVLKDMHLLQIAIFKNENNNIIKIVQDSSIYDNILYIEVEKKHKKNIFTFKMKIESMEEIKSLLSILKYKFISFQTIMREHYLYKNNVNIYLVNYPGIVEFVNFESHSKEKLEKAYEYLGYKKEEVKTLEEVVDESDKFFGTKTDLYSNIEFDKYLKIIKYVKKNKELFKKMVEKQYKKYKNLLDLFGIKIKIYDKLAFI